MATRKHNEFLDLPGSDEEDNSQGYDSEADDLVKGGRTSKRRKVDSDLSGDENEDDQDSEAEEKKGAGPVSKTKIPKNQPETHEEKSEANESVIKTSKRTVAELPGISKPLSRKNLVATEAATKRSGVVYISRVPPFMKPQKLRSLLEPFGEINRIFLTPEDPSSHTKRVRNGGNKKRSFTDGWVEFISKVAAKTACELLNAQIIGGKKGTYYHDDVWNLVYLKGFKWSHLTEQIASENAERASRMRAEISRTRKEDKEFVQNVDRAKMLEGMEAKKAAKRQKDDVSTKQDSRFAAAESMNGASEPKPKKGGERARSFKQTAVAQKNVSNQPDQVKRVLSKIF